MSRRTAGVSFVAIAALLFTTRYCAAAIWGSGFTSWNAEHFTNLLGYVDQGLTTWSIVALVSGLIYLVWAEIDEIRS
jgi:hypothetical protein